MNDNRPIPASERRKGHSDPPKYLAAAEKDGKITDLRLLCHESERYGFERECWEKESRAKFFNVEKVSRDIGIKRGRIESYPLNDAPVPNRVRCIETGETWATVRALHKTLEGVTRWTLDLRIKNHLAVNGLHYEIIRNDNYE